MTMGIVSWITKKFTRSDSKEARQLSAMLTQGTGLGVLTGAWTDGRIEQSRHFKHWIYIAINRIADKIACQFPNIGNLITTYAPNRNLSTQSNIEKYKSIIRSCNSRKALTPLGDHQDLEHVKADHPLPTLLHDPNDTDTSYDLWYETILFLLLEGSAYWWMPRNSLGLPTAIWVLPSHWVWPNMGKERLIDSYDLRPTDGNYLRKTIPFDEILHFRKKNPISKIDGFTAMTAGAQWLDIQEAIDRSRWHTFKNGAFPSCALEFDPAFKDPTTEELDRIEAKFLARYQGEIRTGRPLLLPPGVKFHKLSITPREFDYCKSAEQIRDEVLALFGVPHVIAGISKNHTKGSLAEAKNTFYETTINPLCRFLGQTITERLAKLYDKNLRVWWDDMSTEDPQLVEERLLDGVKFGLIAANEWRAFHGWDKFEYGGDNPVIIPIGVGLPWGDGKPDMMFTPLGNRLTSSSDDVLGHEEHVSNSSTDNSDKVDSKKDKLLSEEQLNVIKNTLKDEIKNELKEELKDEL